MRNLMKLWYSIKLIRLTRHEEIFGIVSLGSYQINPSKLDTVAKFGKILNVKNESNYLVLELEMRDKLVDRLLNLKIMEKNINA